MWLERDLTWKWLHSDFWHGTKQFYPSLPLSDLRAKADVAGELANESPSHWDGRTSSVGTERSRVEFGSLPIQWGAEKKARPTAKPELERKISNSSAASIRIPWPPYLIICHQRMVRSTVRFPCHPKELDIFIFSIPGTKGLQARSVDFVIKRSCCSHQQTT